MWGIKEQEGCASTSGRHEGNDTACSSMRVSMRGTNEYAQCHLATYTMRMDTL